VDLLVPEIDVADAQVADFLSPSAMSDSKQEHSVLPLAEFLRSPKKTLQLFAAHKGNSSPDLFGSLFGHPNHVLDD
jgi:hypothetical protein